MKRRVRVSARPLWGQRPAATLVRREDRARLSSAAFPGVDGYLQVHRGKARWVPGGRDAEFS